jgi:hypothetical protein
VFDRVRKAEHRALRAAGDETLTGTKYLWLYAAERMPEKQQDRFLLLQAMDLKTARPWVIKEALRHLWSYQREALDPLVRLGHPQPTEAGHRGGSPHPAPPAERHDLLHPTGSPMR